MVESSSSYTGLSDFHEPALLRETLQILAIKQGEIWVDLTLGGAGHAEAILQELGESGWLVGLDRDQEAYAAAKDRLERFGERAVLVHENFINLDRVLSEMGVARVNGFFMDLGLSAHQLESAERGFSFRKQGPLDMRMDQREPETAQAILERAERKELARIIREYGEEPMADKIARKITELRGRGRTPSNTIELRQLIETIIPARATQRSAASQKSSRRARTRRIHPATRTFMALRIAVNRELENIESVLAKTMEFLAPGGRIGVISYHSLEDRIVKRFFAEQARGCICPPSAPECRCGRKPQLKILTKKPVRPCPEEIARNPLCRSARLRAAERIEVMQ
jgi:16S rRNA (cytosine1402-N4)-methyltransferase